MNVPILLRGFQNFKALMWQWDSKTRDEAPSSKKQHKISNVYIGLSKSKAATAHTKGSQITLPTRIKRPIYSRFLPPHFQAHSLCHKFAFFQHLNLMPPHQDLCIHLLLSHTNLKSCRNRVPTIIRDSPHIHTALDNEHTRHCHSG